MVEKEFFFSASSSSSPVLPLLPALHTALLAALHTAPLTALHTALHTALYTALHIESVTEQPNSANLPLASSHTARWRIPNLL